MSVHECINAKYMQSLHSVVLYSFQKEMNKTFFFYCCFFCYQFTAISITSVAYFFFLCSARKRIFTKGKKGQKTEGGKMWRQDIFLFNIPLFVIFLHALITLY